MGVSLHGEIAAYSSMASPSICMTESDRHTDWPFLTTPIHIPMQYYHHQCPEVWHTVISGMAAVWLLLTHNRGTMQ